MPHCPRRGVTRCWRGKRRHRREESKTAVLATSRSSTAASHTEGGTPAEGRLAARKGLACSLLDKAKLPKMALLVTHEQCLLGNQNVSMRLARLASYFAIETDAAFKRSVVLTDETAQSEQCKWLGEPSCLPRYRGRHVHVYTETHNIIV